MIDYHKQITSALKTVGLPLHYELSVNSKTKVPCITYLELTDTVTLQSDITDVSIVSYQVKVWANNITTIQQYAPEVDRVMRAIGMKRTGAVELTDTTNTMIQKVFTYEANALEIFN